MRWMGAGCILVLVVLFLLSGCSRTRGELPAGSRSNAYTSSAQAREAAPPGDAGPAEVGKAIYMSNCAACHQPNAEGTLSLFPSLNRNAFVMVSNPAGLIETVLYGRRIMPGFAATLSAQEIAAVLSYIRNAWNNQAPVVTEAQVREVQARNDALTVSTQ